MQQLRKTSGNLYLSHVNLSFINGKNSLPVLIDISLEISSGLFITVVGPSGCGKTTLLKVIGGLLTKNDKQISLKGEILVGGVEPSQAKFSRMFGFAFQNPVLLPWRTVSSNVKLPFELIGHNNTQDGEKILDLLKLMAILNFADAYPNQLSGGMQQRVNIARALVHDPSILLMDEPFGSLDELTRERLNCVLLNIHRVKQPTIIFITHSLTEAAFLSDKIIVLTHRPAKIKCIINSTLGPDRPINIKTSIYFARLVEQLRAELADIN